MMQNMTKDELARLIGECIANNLKMEHCTETARRSVVRVYFPQRGMTLAYYNDLFDLKIGDLVYVDGKLAGMQGRVESVSYNFKIRLADFKRVLRKVDTAIHGQLHLVDGYFVDTEGATLPKDKILSWFLPPQQPGEYVNGYDDSTLALDLLDDPEIPWLDEEVISQGYGYLQNGKVLYLYIDGENSCAVVQGSKPYLVEFCYRDGLISRVTCPCYYGGYCKHIAAALLQLREMQTALERRWPDRAFTRFACIEQETLMKYAANIRSGISVNL